MYSCSADNEDELTFKKDEIIVILDEVEEEWWVSGCHGVCRVQF